MIKLGIIDQLKIFLFPHKRKAKRWIDEVFELKWSDHTKEDSERLFYFLYKHNHKKMRYLNKLIQLVAHLLHFLSLVKTKRMESLCLVSH